MLKGREGFRIRGVRIEVPGARISKPVWQGRQIEQAGIFPFKQLDHVRCPNRTLELRPQPNVFDHLPCDTGMEGVGVEIVREAVEIIHRIHGPAIGTVDGEVFNQEDILNDRDVDFHEGFRDANFTLNRKRGTAHPGQTLTEGGLADDVGN